MENNRHEVIQVNGATILVVMVLLANLLVVGTVYRWHNYELFRAEKTQNVLMRGLYQELRDLQLVIVEHEGAASWNETEYARTLPLRSRALP